MNGEGISLVGPSFPYSYIGGFIPGSIPFVDGAGRLTENNPVLYWDNVNIRLGIGAPPTAAGLHIVKNDPVAAMVCYNTGGPYGFLGRADIGSPLLLQALAGVQRMIVLQSGKTRLGAGNPVSFLEVEGSIGKQITATAATPFLLSDVHNILFVTTGAGAFVVNLPTATGCTGREYVIKKIDAGVGVCTVTPNGAETIDGAANYALASINKYVTLVSNGAIWFVVSNN